MCYVLLYSETSLSNVLCLVLFGNLFNNMLYTSVVCTSSLVYIWEQIYYLSNLLKRARKGMHFIILLFDPSLLAVICYLSFRAVMKSLLMAFSIYQACHVLCY